MEYRVMIDGCSPLAEKHAQAARSVLEVQGTKDGDASSSVKHPVLHCSQIDLSHPTFLRAQLPLGEGGQGPTLWIPYGHVLGILTVSDDVAGHTVEDGEVGKESSPGGTGYLAQPSVH